MSEPQMSDAETDDVLAGLRPEGRDDLAPLADVVVWLRIESQTAAPPRMGPELGDRLARSGAGSRSSGPGRLRTAALGLAAAATIAVGLVVSGSRGVLPGPVQTVVADVGDAVGAAFPRPQRDPDAVRGPGVIQRPDDNPAGSHAVGGDEVPGIEGAEEPDGVAPSGHADAGEGHESARDGEDGPFDVRCQSWLDEHPSGTKRAPAARDRGGSRPWPGGGHSPDGPPPGLDRHDLELPDGQGRDTSGAGRSRGAGTLPSGQGGPWDEPCDRPEHGRR
jgi:hypothetical protein